MVVQIFFSHFKLNRPISLLKLSIFSGPPDTPEKIERFNREIGLFNLKWEKNILNGDPYYNQNLSVKDGFFNIRNIESEKIGQPYYSLEMRNFLKDKAKDIYNMK